MRFEEQRCRHCKERMGGMNIYAKIVDERKRLQKEIKLLERELRGMPEGTIVLNKNGSNFKWYHQTWVNQEKKIRRKYIRHRDRNLAVKLATKKYYQSKLNADKNMVDCMDRFLLHYKEDRSVRMLVENEEYRKLLKDVLPELSEGLDEWEKEEYETNPNFPEDLKYKTMRGELVRSKSEVIIANTLYVAGIPYRYECRLDTEGDRRVYPDFTVKKPRTGEIVVWEHFGMMGQESYRDNAAFKMGEYLREGFYPGVNMIVTFESAERALDVEVVDMWIRWLKEE